MTNQASSNQGIPKAPAIPPPPQRECGHQGYFNPTEIAVWNIPGGIDRSGGNPRINFVSVAGGARKLVADRCRCRYVSYQLETAGRDPQQIGSDPEVIAAALTSLLGDPEVQVFQLSVIANGRKSVIIPRHHLPLMMVEGN